MTWAVPGWYALILLALASYRVFRILAEDAVLDPIRERLAPEGSKRSDFLTCPSCAGFWVCVLAWVAWVAWPHWSLVVAAPFAISALVILVAKYGPD